MNHPQHQQLEDLAWAIDSSSGFSLILAHCNHPSGLVQELQQLTSAKIRVIHLKESTERLYETIKTELADEQPAALMILGLESVRELDNLLIAANQVREEFRKNFPFPVVLWVNDEVLSKLVRLAPDLESWGTVSEL